MYILLAAATSFEIQPTMDLLKDKSHAPGAPETEVLLTGIGTLPTAWSLMRQIGRRRPDLIIQAGIAGCFIPGRIGEVLAVKDEALADLGVQENQAFKTLFDLGFVNRNETPFTDGLLVNPHTRLLDQTGLQQVRAITINEISTDKNRIDWYQQNIAPVVESMEGGALHYISLKENIPFLQIRSISNDIGQRDKTKWDIRSSITNLNRQLAPLLENIIID